MNSHTPGPWFFGQNEAQKANPVEEQQWTVCIGEIGSSTSGCRGDEYMCIYGLCKQSDARLMASAPDLLAALLAISDVGHGIATDDGQAWEAVEAAIAKATEGGR